MKIKSLFRRFLAAAFLLFPLMAAAQTRTLTGTVLDEKGEPMIGAVVASQDGKSGAMTDAQGAFSLKVRTNDQSVTVSFLGYLQQTVDISGKDKISVRLLPDPGNALNEVVIIGYGEVKKADLTGSVANVKMADIKDTPALSVDNALQGRIAGVDVMSTTGEPGATTSIRIRGTRSITASNEPLIVVDGVVGAVHDLNDINSDDIENISILKDASATAIYGSQGSNGVLIVTTKSGVASKPNIQFKARFGLSQIARTLDTMNASEFAQYMNDWYFWRTGASGTTPLPYDPTEFGKGTNWLKEITRIAKYQDYNVSMGGKERKIDYYTAVGYTDQEGIVDGSGLRRFTGRLNVGYQVFKWLKVSYKGSYQYRRQFPNKAAIGGTNIWNGAIYLSPVISPHDSWNPLYENGNYINTPRTNIDQVEYHVDYHTTFHTAVFDIKPAKNWKIRSQNSYMLYQRHDYHFWPSTLTAKRPGDGADAYRYEGDAQRLTSDNTVTWSKNFRRGHHADVMGGYSAFWEVVNKFSLEAKGLLVDALKWNNMNGIASKENYTASTSASKVVRTSFFARANYNYKGRYYLTMTGRFDGSSNFAENRKWGFFPSAAFKWAAKKERFLARTKWLDDLSVRLSYGMSGNDAISSYRSLEAYSSTTGGYLFNGIQTASYYLSRVGNPNLTWEKTRQANLAIEAAFLRKRLNATVELYDSSTRDLLLSVQTIQSTGFGSRFTNLGRTSNRGVELTISSRNIDKKDFAWLTDFTISHNRQMVEDIGNETYVSCLNSWGNNSYMMYGYKKGYPLNSLWGFQYAGFWKSNEAIERNNYTRGYVSTALSGILGHPRYVDQNKDGVLSEQDLVYLGNSDPFLYGGLQNTFHYKNWKLTVYFSYSLGGKLYNYSELFMGGSYRTNQYRYMLDAWHPVRNPDGKQPRAATDDAFVPSSRQVHDASYIRLKSASLSYTLPLKKKTVFRDATFTLSGDNLLLISKYNGFDPDVSTESSGSTLRRVDMGAYPKARMIVLGVQLRY